MNICKYTKEIFFIMAIAAILLSASSMYAATSPTMDLGGYHSSKSRMYHGVRPELDIYRKANEIAKMGWSPNKQYRMDRRGNVCVNGQCYNLRPVGIARTRAGGRYSDYYGSAIMSKMLMEYILGYKVPFTSGDRPNGVGSNRHHTNGASYAFDLRSSGRTSEKVKIAAAWKFAAQTFKFPASVGMMYAKTPTMVHVDTKPIGRGQSHYWGWGGKTNGVGSMVLRYYGKKHNTYMPYQVLAAAFNGRAIAGAVDTGTLNGVQTSLPALRSVRNTTTGDYAQQHNGAYTAPSTGASAYTQQPYYFPVHVVYYDADAVQFVPIDDGVSLGDSATVIELAPSGGTGAGYVDDVGNASATLPQLQYDVYHPSRMELWRMKLIRLLPWSTRTQQDNAGAQQQHVGRSFVW